MLKDFLGQSLVAGQSVVYPGRKGSSLWMNKGQVLKVNHDGKNDITVQPAIGRRSVRIARPDRVVIVAATAPVQPHVMRAGADHESASADK